IPDVKGDFTRGMGMLIDLSEKGMGQRSRRYSMLVKNGLIEKMFIEQRSLGMVLPGLSCGFYDLDAMTQGFQRSDLIITAARPAMGKTSFVLNVARNIAAEHKQPVAIFSLEMSKQQLIYRLLSSEAKIESGRLRTGRIAQHEWGPMGHAINTLSELPIFIDDTPGIGVTEIRSKARRLQAENGGALGLILIDYLQLMEGTGDNRVQELSKMTRSLKGLARELNVPIICLSQLSRGVESRTNKRPMMSDLRESGAIEQDADLIMMLYREEYYDPDTPDRGIAEVILTKHRNGPTGTVKLLFQPEYTQFLNRASDLSNRE
ncbi:MAG: replicative DNA helicase, partial [Cyanobacteria bacterium J06631_9]